MSVQALSGTGALRVRGRSRVHTCCAVCAVGVPHRSSCCCSRVVTAAVHAAGSSASDLPRFVPGASGSCVVCPHIPQPGDKPVESSLLAPLSSHALFFVPQLGCEFLSRYYSPSNVVLLSSPTW